MTYRQLLSPVLKMSVVLAVLVEMLAPQAIVPHGQALVAQLGPMPHQQMAAINPLKLLVPLQLPSSASARLSRPHPLARLRTEQENKHAATSTP
jgi:hypothetical protein